MTTYVNVSVTGINFSEIDRWCQQHLGSWVEKDYIQRWDWSPNWTEGNYVRQYEFSDENDALLFMLKWL